MESTPAANLLLSLLFITGYFFITLEHLTKVNKATCALLMAVFSWMILFQGHPVGKEMCENALCSHLSTVSEVILFLLGALTIVETINLFDGFFLLRRLITTQGLKRTLWLMAFMTFFLSAILDNLTTTVVMVTLLTKIMEKSESRMVMGAALVIAANAGGAWTPIGDVTTTMLWIGGQLSAWAIMKSAFLPSLVSVIISLIWISFLLPKEKLHPLANKEEGQRSPWSLFILLLGLFVLIMVPVIKVSIGLPPYMSMLLGLAILWLVTDLLHAFGLEKLQIPHVLTKIDLSGVLFFLGILLAVAALDASGLLVGLARSVDSYVQSPVLISIFIGITSALVDNVPLVAMSMGMYSLETFPQDHFFWQLTAYTAGTGGSLLLIGSAAGIVFMGIEHVDFFWYCRRITLPALAGFLAGVLVFIFLF